MLPDALPLLSELSPCPEGRKLEHTQVLAQMMELSSGAVVREKRAGQGAGVSPRWVEPCYLKSERLVLTGRQVMWALATHRHGELLGDGGA